MSEFANRLVNRRLWVFSIQVAKNRSIMGLYLTCRRFLPPRSTKVNCVTLNIAGGRKMDPVIEDVFPIKNRDIPLLLLMV